MLSRPVLRNGVIHGASLLKIVLLAWILAPESYLKYVGYIAYAQLFAAVAGLGCVECISRDYVRDKIFYFNYAIVWLSILVLILVLLLFGKLEVSNNVFLLGAYTFSIFCFQSLQKISRVLLGLSAFYEHLTVKVAFDLILIVGLFTNSLDGIIQILFFESSVYFSLSIFVFWRIRALDVPFGKQDSIVLLKRSMFFYMTAVISNISGNIFRFIVGSSEILLNKEEISKLPLIDVSIQIV